MASRVPAARAGIALLAALSLVLGSVPGAAMAVSPVDGEPLAVLPVTINVDPGDQYDPHVSGDLVTYTAANKIRIYDFFSGTDVQLPSPDGAADLLSDVDGGRISFTRMETTGRTPVLVYDWALGTTTEVDPEVDPEPAPIQIGSAIGANTVAFIDQRLSIEGELVVSDLGRATVRITTDTRIDQLPAVSPTGDVVVYESCGQTCDIHQAAGSGASWVVTELTTNAEPEGNPDTDGIVVVYDATRSGEWDIRWQPVGGGTEEVLTLPGAQRNPSVSAGLIVFESVADGGNTADLFVYEIASNRLFRITTTPSNDNLNDVFVLPDGRVRVVWSSGVIGERDVYGATLELPPVEPPVYAFSGFLQPVDAPPTLNLLKAGAAVPVKFSLGGDRGLEIFAAGYPRSQTIACDSTAAVDGIEQTTTAGGSSLTYDPVADAYTYVWKTDKAWAGTCRQLVIGLADGTFQRANFKLK